MYTVLVTLSQIMAPLTPFLSEEIYTNLASKESVHLSSWPKSVNPPAGFTALPDQMKQVRKIVELGLSKRKDSQIKVRQPLSELKIKNTNLSEEFLELIRDELNVKRITVDENLASEVELDTNFTLELIEEGRVRDAIRAIQDIRKEKGLKPGDKMKFVIPVSEEGFFLKHKIEIERATDVEFN